LIPYWRFTIKESSAWKKRLNSCAVWTRPRLGACLRRSTSSSPRWQAGSTERLIHCLKAGDAVSLEAALRVMRTLQGAFQDIRPEALQMERQGQIPALDRLRALEVSA
jgi:hypothetical protein